MHVAKVDIKPPIVMLGFDDEVCMVFDASPLEIQGMNMQMQKEGPNSCPAPWALGATHLYFG